MIQIFDFRPDMTMTSTRYAVTRCKGTFCLIARTPIEQGLPIFLIEGVEMYRPSFASVQVASNVHIDMAPDVDLTDQMDLYPWRFMNHSCDANCYIRDRCVIALRAIEPGEELTFDYNSTEYEMAQPFDCTCGSPKCAGQISGWRHRA
jgi:hypothetical protein